MKRAMILLSVLVVVAAPAVAVARRLATTREHAALARTFLGAHSGVPLRCTRAYISTVNRTWASIAPVQTGSCSTQPLGDGLAILHVEHRRWRIVTEGSAFRCPIQSYPHQPRVPASVTADLIRYVRCA